MIVGKAIYHLLTNATDVTDIVNTRIYPEIAQQDADLPYIVYNVANNEPTDTKPEPSKLDTAQVEVNIYSDSYTECIDLAVAVRAALDRVKGTYAGVNVQSIQYLNEIIDFDEPQRAYNISADYDVRISRTDFEIAQGSPITGVQLGELSDVDVDGVTNGQLIAYNSDSGNWEAADDAGGAETIGALNDVSITTPADREALIYDGGNWVNDNISKSDVGLGNVDNTSDADKPVSSATQTALNAKADTSAVPTELNDLSDVTIAGTPAGNEALIFDTATSSFKSLPNFTNRFEDEAENNKPATPFGERVYTVKADGDGIFIDAQSDTPSSGKVIERKIYHKAGFLESGDVIGDFTLIHTFADDTAYSATESVFEGFRDGDTYGSPPFTLIQTWEEVDQVTTLLDSYGGAEGAYSVRLLRAAYSGSCLRVRRASDNAEQDIGFDGSGNVDSNAISTFCSGTNGFLRKWYDQSGNANDVNQTTTAEQPKIYDSVAGVITENGNVALELTDGLHKITYPNLSTSLGDAYVVSNIFGTNNQPAVFTGQGGPLFWPRSSNSTALVLTSYKNGTILSPQTRGEMYTQFSQQGQSLFSGIGTYASLYAMQSGVFRKAGFRLQEVIRYTNSTPANQSGIEDNINTFYSIY